MKLINNETTNIEVLTYETSIEGVIAKQTITNGKASNFTLQCIDKPDHIEKVWVGISSNAKPCTYEEFKDSCKFGFEDVSELNSENVYFIYDYGHVIFDHEWNVVPYIHSFDYIGTPFHNGCLDLDKALQVLKNHPWIINKDGLKIEDIPYYNVDDEQDAFIKVSILPDKDTYNKLYQQVKNMQSWSVRLKELLHDGYCPDEEHNLLGLLECVK